MKLKMHGHQFAAAPSAQESAMQIRSLLLISLSAEPCELPEHPLELALEVHYAESLEAAFTIVSCEEIDLLLLDCESMKSNLMVVLQLLEINPLTSAMPILLLDSAESLQDLDLAVKQTLVLGAVSKDLPPQELAKSIQEVCAKASD